MVADTAPLSVPPVPATPRVGLERVANVPAAPPSVPVTRALAPHETPTTAAATRDLARLMCFLLRSDPVRRTAARNNSAGSCESGNVGVLYERALIHS